MRVQLLDALKGLFANYTTGRPLFTHATTQAKEVVSVSILPQEPLTALLVPNWSHSTRLALMLIANTVLAHQAHSQIEVLINAIQRLLRLTWGCSGTLLEDLNPARTNFSVLVLVRADPNERIPIFPTFRKPSLLADD